MLFTTGFFMSCSEKKEVPDQPVSVEKYTISQPSGDTGNTVKLLANDAAIEAAFTLDYRPQKAEGEDTADFLSAADLAGAAAGGAGQGTVLGGGLRKLSDYKTEYFDPVSEKSRIETIRTAQEASRIRDGQGQLSKEDAGPLTVIDWGPRGNYSSAIQRPSIYVVFSQPMVALASLGEQSSVSPVVSINPPLKGSFRWYGTGFLSFEGDEPCQSQQIYTITVANNAASIYGVKVSGDRTFSFLTETLSIKNISPGEEFRKTTGFNFDNQSVPPEAAKQIGMEFNYPVQADDINQYLEITGGNTRRQLTLKQENEYKITADLIEAVDFNTQVTVTLKKGAKSRGGSRGTEADQSFSFRTPGIFKVTDLMRIPGYGRYRNLVTLDFSYALNRETVQQAISTEPAMLIGKENIEVWGNRVMLSNMPIGYGSHFKLFVAASVEDVFGRKLNEQYSCDIVVPDEPPPEGEARFLDYGHAMLEAQFPPRFLFEYKNIAPNSFYRIAASLNPWMNPTESRRVDLLPGSVNARYFEEIDLSPYLNPHGRGFVAFNASLQLLATERLNNGTYRTRTRKTENELAIQVTDLGLTVRYGFNKVTVLVTSLSTGLPVEGVNVRLLSPAKIEKDAELSSSANIVEAQKTDKNGLAVLRMGASILRDQTLLRNDSYGELFVLAEKDGDKAVFNPRSHNSWHFGIDSGWPQRAEEITALTFMFSDRGLYKPGEVLTFRGVDRSKVLGMYTIYQGAYTVALEEDTYNPQSIASVNGATTESGGFHGAINVPDDLKPGSYRLVYRRDVSLNRANDIIANVPITVAYFERLKFQAALSAPAAAIIRGDDINLNLRATYLSGGSLSGASWESAWYEEMSVFTPKQAETKGYVFGPRRVWDSKRYIASESGNLSGQGTASLSQKTGGGNVTGAPYLYQAEARVTDISNQMVSAYRSVQVHPASFYIGLYRNAGGFARAGQDLSFNYIAVDN